MRVYHLIKGLGRGGAEMLLPAGIAASTADNSFAVGYFLSAKSDLVPTLREQGVHVDAFGSGSSAGMALAIPRVARAVKAWGADVLHCHLPLAGVAGRLAARTIGVPVVYTEHNVQEQYRRPTYLANRATWHLQREVIACSAEVAQSIARHNGDRVPVHVVRNGVDAARFGRRSEEGRALKAQLGIAEDAPVVGTIAVFRAEKRLDAWIDAAAAIRARVPGARFVIVGDGPLRPELERRADATGLGDALLLPGLQSDVRPWLGLMDVFMIASAFEGLPIALLEAMASEVPAVCTRVGGIAEAVRDGLDGHVVPADDPQALVEPVCALLQDPERARIAGRSARDQVVERFGMRRMTDEIERIYDAALTR